jgi:hypothetical protein
MYVVEVSDRQVFRDKAQASGAMIGVLRFATVKPVRVGNTVTMTPAVVLTYFFDADDQQWTYSETRYADEGGRASVEGTLLDEIEETGMMIRPIPSSALCAPRTSTRGRHPAHRDAAYAVTTPRAWLP